jgi:adenine/guanine phosphoribosyltransferase-like PRPP-binding protein
MNYRNISDLNNLILKRLFIIPSNIDCVVGIPRSGLIPAILISLYRNLPYCDLHSFIKGEINTGGERLKAFDFNKIENVLIIDDSLWSGNSLEKVKRLTSD